MKVFILQHVYITDSDLNEETKFIGVFENKALAINAVETLSKLEGFSSFSQIIDCVPGEEGEGGFIIDEYAINEVHWDQGFN